MIHFHPFRWVYRIETEIGILLYFKQFGPLVKNLLLALCGNRCVMDCAVRLRWSRPFENVAVLGCDLQ